MKNQIPPPSSGSATANSDAVSLLPRRSSRSRPGAANAYSSHTDPPVSNDKSDSRSVPRRTSRLRRPGVEAAHPPEPPRNSRVRRARIAGAAADPDPDPSDDDAAADPDPDPPDDGPTSEPSSRLRRNSRLSRSRRSGTSAAADPDPKPPVYDDDGRSDRSDDDDGDSEDEDPTWVSDENSDDDHAYSTPSGSRLSRSRRLGHSDSAADRDRQPPADSLQGRNSRLRTTESPRRRSHSRSLGATAATAADPNPVPQVSENSEFPNSDEWGAIEGLVAQKERAHLPPKNQSLEKPENEMNDQLNNVHASLNADDWQEMGQGFDGKSVHSFEINSKEDEISRKAPAAEADWAVKSTRSGDARFQQMIKLQFDKFSSKLNQMYEDIKDIKQILLTINSKENRNIKLQENVAGSD